MFAWFWKSWQSLIIKRDQFSQLLRDTMNLTYLYFWMASLAVTDEIALMQHQVKEHWHKYQCGDCGKLFSNRVYARKHMLTHSTNKKQKAKKSHICWICDYNAPGPFRLSQHILKHYKRKKPKWRRKIKFFNCKGCSFLTVWSNALKKPVKHNCPNRPIILLFTTKNIKLQPSTPGCIRVYQAATKYIEVQSSTSM